MMELRVIFDGKKKGFWNMALDESLLFYLKDYGPTLRFYGWAPPAISVGYFQSLEENVNVEEAKRRGVDVVRRITGGGAVYHKWEVTYSIVMPPPPGKVLDSYKIIERGIIEGFKKLGIEAQYAGVNDIIVQGKKISGNAQTRKYGGLLQHGTILMDVDVDEMFSLLKVPEEKIRDKIIKDVKHRVTSLRHLGIDIDFEELQKVLAEGFEKALGTRIYEESVDEKILKKARKLEVEKYASRKWNYRR